MSDTNLRNAQSSPGAGKPAAPARTHAAGTSPHVPYIDHGDSWHWRASSTATWWERFGLGLLTRKQVGIDIGSRWIKYAVVNHTLRSTRVVAAGAVPVAGEARGEMGKIRAQVGALLAVRERIGTTRARWIVGMGGAGTMVRTVELPRMPQSELRTAVLWQAQKKFPFPLDDAHVALTFLSTAPKQPVKAVVAAALKRQVEDFLFLLSEAEIHPSAIVLPAFGMAEALLTTGPIPSGEFNGVINIGAERSLFAVFRGGKLEFFRELDVGTGDVEQALSDEITESHRTDLPSEPKSFSNRLFYGASQIPSDDSGETEAPMEVQGALDKLVLEIQSTMEYYAAQSGGLRVNKFFLTGGGTGIAGIRHHLEHLLEIPVRILTPAVPGLLPETMDTEGLSRPAIWSGALGFALLSRRLPNLLPPDLIRRNEQQFNSLIWRSATGAALTLAMLLSGAEYYRAERSEMRLGMVLQQITDTSRRLDQIGVQHLETTLASNQRWLAAVTRPDLCASDLLRTLAASTPPTIVLDRIDVVPSDSGWAHASLGGEVRAEHAENEVVLANYVHRLGTTGYFTDVSLADYRTARQPEFERITFRLTCRVPLEVIR